MYIQKGTAKGKSSFFLFHSSWVKEQTKKENPMNLFVHSLVQIHVTSQMKKKLS